MPSDEPSLEDLMHSDMMEEAADYVARGRVFRQMPDDEVRQKWIEATETWYATQRTAERQREMDDLSAELRLRRVAPPFKDERLRSTLAKLGAELDQVSPGEAGEIIERKVRDLLSSSKKATG